MKRVLCQRLDAACQAHYRAHAVPESGADAYQHLYLQALRTVLARTDGSSACDAWDVTTRNTMADKAEARAEAQPVDQPERAAAYRECAGALREQGPGDGAERASYPHWT